MFGTDGDPVTVPAQPVAVYDVAGAGDTVISTLTLALAAGAAPPEAVTLANIAGAVVVKKVGVATTSREEILEMVATEAGRRKLRPPADPKGGVGPVPRPSVVISTANAPRPRSPRASRSSSRQPSRPGWSRLSTRALTVTVLTVVRVRHRRRASPPNSWSKALPGESVRTAASARETRRRCCIQMSPGPAFTRRRRRYCGDLCSLRWVRAGHGLQHDRAGPAPA